MRISRSAPIVVTAMLVASAVNATVYNDAVGDEAFPNPHLDIVSVEIMNDLTDIMFTVNLSGDPIATDWGKYLVGIDSVPGGDPAGNGWGRPILMPTGMDEFIGSWVDWGDGAETYSWDGAAWNLGHATYNPPSEIQFPDKTSSSITLTSTLTSLGLSVGDTFTFDVFTTGGGGTDSAIDALSDPTPTVANWGDPYTSTSELRYEVVIPEPATVSLILLGVGAMLLRRFRRA